MTTKTIAVTADFDHNGIDVKRELRTGMMPRFRLETMPERFFFLTAQVDVEHPIPHGTSGVVLAVIIGEPRFADMVVPGVVLDVYGLPTQKIGKATVVSVNEA